VSEMSWERHTGDEKKENGIGRPGFKKLLRGEAGG
jgi:hypothetical protein